MRKLATLALGAMLMFGCAHSPPPAPEPLPAHQADAPPPAAATPAPAPASPSVSLRLQMDPRPGWVSLPPSAVPEGVSGLMLNPSAHALIMVMIEAPATSTAREGADTIRGQLSSGADAWTCSAVTAWPDANSASFTVSKGTNRGHITVRRLHEGPAINVAFLGQWPAASNAAARADYDAMVTGAAIH